MPRLLPASAFLKQIKEKTSCLAYYSGLTVKSCTTVSSEKVASTQSRALLSPGFLQFLGSKQSSPPLCDFRVAVPVTIRFCCCNNEQTIVFSFSSSGQNSCLLPRIRIKNWLPVLGHLVLSVIFKNSSEVALKTLTRLSVVFLPKCLLDWLFSPDLAAVYQFTLLLWSFP